MAGVPVRRRSSRRNKQQVEYTPVAAVEISVEGRNLRTSPLYSSKGLVCVFYTRELRDKSFKERGRTESINKTGSPRWLKKFNVDFYFEERQDLRFCVYRLESEIRDTDTSECLGCMECTLGELFNEFEMERCVRDANGKSTQGQIIARVERKQENQEDVCMTWAAHGLPKWFFGKPKFILVFERQNVSLSNFICVHKTKAADDICNCQWPDISLSISELCNGDYDRRLRIQLHDSRGKKEKLIGQVEKTLAELRDCGSRQQLQLHNHRGKPIDTLLELKTIDFKQRHSFVEYLEGQLRIHLEVFIDFTSSNGHPTSPTSKHYMDPLKPNQYFRALTAIGDILGQFRCDRQIAAYGFGALMPQDNKMPPLFPLNGQQAAPECANMTGVLEAYRYTLEKVSLYGPTNMAPLVDHVASKAADHMDGSIYYVQLILCDGIISDMEKTIPAIIKASELPMSIIIIGIGDTNFSGMRKLDGDEEVLRWGNQAVARDIVQFVAFNDFDLEGGGSDTCTHERLRREVLAELPEQVVAYMTAHGITPVTSQNRASFVRMSDARGSLLV